VEAASRDRLVQVVKCFGIEFESWESRCLALLGVLIYLMDSFNVLISP